MLISATNMLIRPFMPVFLTESCSIEKTVKTYQHSYIRYWSLHKEETLRSAWSPSRPDKPYCVCTCCRKSSWIYMWRHEVTKQKIVYWFTFFLRILKKKNLSETGEDLQSAPNVSLRLRRIEQRLDVALFQGSLYSQHTLSKLGILNLRQN